MNESLSTTVAGKAPALESVDRERAIGVSHEKTSQSKAGYATFRA
jgi:hypothetical protein